MARIGMKLWRADEPWLYQHAHRGCQMAVPLGASKTRDRQLHEPRLWHPCADSLLNMPQLTWSGKKLAQTAPASLIKESIIYRMAVGIQAAAHESSDFGDNLAVMTALLPEYEGRINLLYADPPFFTNRKYSARIGRGEDSRKPGEVAVGRRLSRPLG